MMKKHRQSGSSSSSSGDKRNGNGNGRVKFVLRQVKGLSEANAMRARHSHGGPVAATCFSSVSLGQNCRAQNAETEADAAGNSCSRSASVSFAQLMNHPLALVALVPKDFSLFIAGAVAGAAAKTVTAPLDRIKILMQTHVVRVQKTGATSKGIGFLEAIKNIGREEGIKGYWKGNLPQVMRIIPYSAVQLFAYEIYKKLFKGDNKELSVVGRLAAGACAGMTSTLVTYPLDVLRLRLAVDPACKSMIQVAISMLKEEGLASFYKGLGPSLVGIAPYIAVNFCVFDMVKKSLPEEYRKKPETSFVTAIISASVATIMCYPLDTVRRQMQIKGSPYKTVFDAVPGIIARDGVLGLYRGFLANALKTLPNSSIRLTTFDSAKAVIQASESELEKIRKENSDCLEAAH